MRGPMPSQNPEFLKQLRRFTASAMISYSALRNQGASGVVQRARAFCTEVSLEDLRQLNGPEYASWLDLRTQELQRCFPRGARKWGPARKALNIFMRSISYTTPLAVEYELERILPHLEVPLDRDVGTRLRKEREGATLPAWESIISLTEARSQDFQDVAYRVARRMGVHRADLDVFYWGA
jgi:hypothetical protein